MSITININGLTLCHRGSGGETSNTLPDVCKTPSKAIPRPFSNKAYSKDLAQGTTTVFADGGNMIANFGSIFAKSSLDGGGSFGGVLSGTFLAEAEFMTHSFDVFFESKPACRLTDKMWMNHKNTVNMAGLKQYSLDPKMNLLCNIFCEIMDDAEEWKKKNPGKSYPYSKNAEALGKGKYASQFAKFGMKAEVSILVKATSAVRTAIAGTSRVIHNSASLLKSIGRRAAAAVVRAGARVLAGMGIGAAGGSVVPVAGTAVGAAVGTAVGVASTAYTAYEIASLAVEAGPMLKSILDVLGDAVKVKPDVAILDKASGGVKEIFDYKFPGDRYREGQKEIFDEAAKGGSKTIDLKNCNFCAAKV